LSAFNILSAWYVLTSDVSARALVPGDLAAAGWGHGGAGGAAKKAHSASRRQRIKKHAAHKEARAQQRVRKRIKKHERLSECGEESREHGERRAPGADIDRWYVVSLPCLLTEVMGLVLIKIVPALFVCDISGYLDIFGQER